MKLNGYEIVSESINLKNIDLSDFDKYFYLRQVSKEEQDKTSIGAQKCVKHNILLNSAIVGFVGYIPLEGDPKIGFVQILILPKYRGKGILKVAEDKLAKLHNLKSLWATIYLDNPASIKAHLKAGFKMFSKYYIDTWRKMGVLKENAIRMYKNYK